MILLVSYALISIASSLLSFSPRNMITYFLNSAAWPPASSLRLQRCWCCLFHSTFVRWCDVSASKDSTTICISSLVNADVSVGKRQETLVQSFFGYIGFPM